VGPATFRTLVNKFGGAAAAIAALPLLSRRGGRSDIRLFTEAEAEAELALAESLGASLVAIGEPGYPPALAQVDSPPPLLYVKGRLELADIPMVAIVGARNGSAVGQNSRGRSPPISARRIRHRLGARPRHRHRRTHGRARSWHCGRAGRRH
jgi:DNA processing protein